MLRPTRRILSWARAAWEGDCQVPRRDPDSAAANRLIPPSHGPAARDFRGMPIVYSPLPTLLSSWYWLESSLVPHPGLTPMTITCRAA